MFRNVYTMTSVVSGFSSIPIEVAVDISRKNPFRPIELFSRQTAELKTQVKHGIVRTIWQNNNGYLEHCLNGRLTRRLFEMFFF